MKKITIYFPIVALLISSLYVPVKAQQDPVFSDYNYNPIIINPGFTALDPHTEIMVGNSGFFNSFEGSPETLMFSFQTPVNNEKVGLGAGLYQDKVGVSSVTNVFASYAYKIHFDLQRDRPHYEYYVPTVLSFGLTTGLKILNDDLLSLGIEDDPNFNQNVKANIPTFGFGAVFNNDKFYAGISSPNLLGDKLIKQDLGIRNTYYGYLGYRIFTNPFREVLVKPSVLFKYQNGAPLQADMNLSFSYKNRFELGAGYRSTSSINLLAGFYMLEHLRLVYHYNKPFGDNPIQHSHGISLSYRFGDGYK